MNALIRSSIVKQKSPETTLIETSMNELSNSKADSPIDVCPFHHARTLQPSDELLCPYHKRANVQYQINDEGQKELFLYYDDLKISFDEPELFTFGENITKQASFVAATATSWGDNLTWARIQDLLQQLIAEGILHYADSFNDELSLEGSRPSRLPPAQTDKPRTWFEIEDITQELTGRSLELGYLEMVMPIFRVAHIYLDAEKRQVGEANVFPKPLRLDVPTEWRTCHHPGSRYMDEKPMNVTALKSIRAQWPQITGALAKIREAYLQRYPTAKDGWTVGSVEALATLVLAVTTYQFMRPGKRVQNGELHPALSSMFRVTDGLRLVTHQMIFIPFGEPTVSPYKPLSTQEVFDYAERNFSFTDEYGVCAGPKNMIEEFLNVLVNGAIGKGAENIVLEPEIQAALDDIPAAFDYGLYGLQIFAIVFSGFPLMTRTYVQLAEIAKDWSGERPALLQTFYDHLLEYEDVLENESFLSSEEFRINREKAYNAIYSYCAQGLGYPETEQNMSELLTPVQDAAYAEMTAQLQSMLQQRLQTGNTADLEKLANCLSYYLIQLKAIISLACTIQERINKLLEREQPKHEFDATAINIHNLMQGKELQNLPYLLDEIAEVFGIRLYVTKDGITLKDIKSTA